VKYSKFEEKAEKIASKAHQYQFRNDNVTPAIYHPRNVVTYLKQIGIENQDIICAAWLHDTVEDSYLTIDYIKKEFNPNIARIVQKLTKNGDREQYKETIKNSDYPVQIIKLADMIDNCSHLDDARLSKDLVKRKIDDCKILYLPIAEKICPEFYSRLLDEIDGIEGFSRIDWEVKRGETRETK
jgi:(p)ppGpp synthase/HD superfamily hydrolase